ncbi:hypothetical protein E2C01_036204 [Portunus trituberculatus]|uniref:Uncharacterized protein n=1 Tax=Portunus trituberculatus TaxID=210409 RepID=A0A5B7F666_PORTR|nr:hypothetical protein [Portunus trituberculatus]
MTQDTLASTPQVRDPTTDVREKSINKAKKFKKIHFSYLDVSPQQLHSFSGRRTEMTGESGA